MLVAQLVINGLGAGAIYAFVALGFALIYNATGVLHLAHGAVFALGGYAFYTAVVLLKMPIPVGCLVAVCASAVFGIAIEKLVYRPLRARKSEHASSMIASIGVLTLGQSVLGIVFGTDSLAMQTEPLKTISVFGLYLNYVHITRQYSPWSSSPRSRFCSSARNSAERSAPFPTIRNCRECSASIRIM